MHSGSHVLNNTPALLATGVSLYVILSRRKRCPNAAKGRKPSKQAGLNQGVAASDGSQPPHAIVAQSRQPSGVNPVGMPHLHLTPKQGQHSTDSATYSQVYDTAEGFETCGSVTRSQTHVSICSIPALHTQTVMHPDAEESDLTQALRELQREQAQQQQTAASDASSAVQSGGRRVSELQRAQQSAGYAHKDPVLNLHSQPILQNNPAENVSHGYQQLAQAADSQQQWQPQEVGNAHQMSEQPRQLKHGGFKIARSQHAQQAPAANGGPTPGSGNTVLGVNASGVHALSEAQVLSRLYVLQCAGLPCTCE